MADIDWPASLPATPDQDGFTDTMPDSAVRPGIDVGPPLAIDRYSSGPEVLDVKYDLSGDETAILDDFYWNTCFGGCRRFNGTDPITGTPCEIRFVTAPTLTSLDGGRFSNSFQVEVLQ